MTATNRTRRASGARGGAGGRAYADYLPEQISFLAGLPHLDGDGVTAVRRFAQSAYPACRRARSGAVSGESRERCDICESPAAGPDDAWSAAAARAHTRRVQPAPYEEYTPVLYAHDGTGFHVASPEQILVQAQHLVERQFYRKGPLVNQPHIVRALLQLKLGAHPRAVFAAFLLTKRYHLIDYVEIFNGTTDRVVIYMREVMREALKRHAEAVIAARNDPTGEGTATLADLADAAKLRWLLGSADIALVDYLIVGKTITSLAERGNL